MGALIARRRGGMIIGWVGHHSFAPPLKGLEWRVMWSELQSEKITSYNLENRWEGSKR